MTLSDLISQFQVLIPAFPYSNYTATVLSWFNEGQDKIAEELLIDDRMYATSEDGEDEIPLPSTLIEIQEDGFYFDGKMIDPKTKRQLILDYGTDWKSETGTPKCYLREGSRVILVPYPNSEADNKEIEIHFWGYANRLSGSGDYPFTTGSVATGYDYHPHLRGIDHLLVEYAIAKARCSLEKNLTEEQALKHFYSMLQNREDKTKHREDMEASRFDMDPFYLKLKKNRGR